MDDSASTLRETASHFDRMTDDELDRRLSKLASSVAKTDDLNRFALFTPLPFQMPWYLSEKKIRCLFGANQIGKTLYLIVSALTSAFGVSPPSISGRSLPQGFPRHRILGRRKILIVGESFTTTIPGNLVPKLEEYLPEGAVKSIRKNSNGCPSQYSLHCGSEVHIMSKDQNPKKFEANVWDFAGIDEPLEQDVFSAIQRGTMARRAPMVISGTPVSGGWMRDVLEMPTRHPGSPMADKIDVFRAKIWDNAMSRGGYLPDDEIEAFLAGLPPRERKAREEGEFLDYAGIEFPQFTRETHVIPDLY